MNIFGIGLPELAVIAAIALLVFGPKRLPEMGRSLGRTLRGFQSASQEFERAFRDGMQPEDLHANSVQLPPPAVATAPTAVNAPSPDQPPASEPS